MFREKKMRMEALTRPPYAFKKNLQNRTLEFGTRSDSAFISLVLPRKILCLRRGSPG
jgi:hypothetical protein